MNAKSPGVAGNPIKPEFEHVTVTFVSGRKSPWMARYYRNDTPVRSFHKTEDKATKEAAELDKILSAGGDPKDIQAATRIVAGTGYTFCDVAKAGLEALRKTGAALSDPTVKFSVGAQMVIDRAKRQKRRPKTIQGYESAYAILNKTLGDCCAAMITVQDVIDYLAGLKGRNGKSAAKAHTKRNAIRHIKMALKRLKIIGTLADLDLPGIEEGPIDFFSAEEAVGMMRIAPADVKGLLIVGFYAALRPELLSVLPASCVEVAKRRIIIPAHLSKDKKSHTLMGRFQRRSGEWVEGTLPDEMWPLLEKYPFRPGNWESIRRFLKRRNGRWVHDGTRRTAATFHDRFRGKESAAALLTHAGESLVYEHYVGDTTPEQADAFFSVKVDDLRSDTKMGHVTHFSYPPVERLREMVENTPVEVVAATIGCSGKALAKHCLKRGIKTKPRGYWAKLAFAVPFPSIEALREMVETTPARTLAETIGCSIRALSKHCRAHGIKTKPRGHWARLESAKASA